jgi:glucokinase
MGILAFDLGGTKLATAFFNSNGEILFREVSALEKRKGAEVGALISNNIASLIEASDASGNIVESIGISVPGIYHAKKGTVWAPNIPGWDDYPLLDEIKNVAGEIPVKIDSDRACYILGEAWQGNATECKDAIFLAVGTGIGAGILIDGNVLRGSHDIAGAIGWMALSAPFKKEYTACGCFEHYCSGEGIAKVAQQYLREKNDYDGELNQKDIAEISCHDVFEAYENNDEISNEVINICIQFWGMAAANLVSLFNPEKIIFGGGVFGPAIPLIPKIKGEAMKWSQPISIKQVSFEASGLGNDAGVFGAGFLALKNIDS